MFSVIVIIVTWVFGIQYLSGARIVANISFVSLLYFPLLLLNYILLWYFVNKRNAIWILVLINCFLLTLKLADNFSVNTRSVLVHKDVQLTISSFNTNLGKKNLLQNDQLSEKFMQTFKDNKIDLMCIQECDLNIEKAIKKSLSGYQFYRYSPLGIDAIVSKYPIIQKGRIELHKNDFGCVWTDLDLGKDTVRVYSAHLFSNNSIESKNSESFFSNALSKLAGFKIGAEKRSQEYKKILDHVYKSNYPVILAGDFNDTPNSNMYYSVTKKYKDAFKWRANGLGTTYMRKLINLRLDYLFLDKQFQVLQFKTIDDVLSDHKMIVAKLAW